MVSGKSQFQCCDRDGEPRVSHQQCAAFNMMSPGGVLGDLYPHQRCHEFTRSIPCTKCSLGARDISNSVSHVLDLQAIYGTTDEQSDAVRSWIGGELVTQTDSNGGELFAVQTVSSLICTKVRYKCTSLVPFRRTSKTMSKRKVFHSTTRRT